MDISTLRVFNSIHSLGITEEEFADLESEQTHTDRTGLYVRTIKRNYALCVSHDDLKHPIVIKKLGKTILTPSRVLFKTLITFDDLPPEIYTLHGIAQYRTMDAEIKHKATNIEELKDRVCDRFIDGNARELGGYYDDVFYRDSRSYDPNIRDNWQTLKSELMDTQLNAIFWLFNEDYTKFNKSVKEARKNIPRIIKVFERNNRRLAIIHCTEDYEKHHQGGFNFGSSWNETIRGSRLKIQCFKPKNKEYDYVDINREIYLPINNGEITEIWLDDAMFEKIGYPELKVLSKRLFADSEVHGKKWILLTPDEFNKKQTLIQLEVMSVARQEQEKEAIINLKRNVDKQFKNGRVERHGIIFRKDSIEYEGVKVRHPALGEHVLTYQIHLQQEPDFKEIIQNFICKLLDIGVIRNYQTDNVQTVCNFAGEETIDIGKVKMHIKKVKNNVYINDFRIRKDDLIEVIFKAITYTTQEKFDAYLKYSSTANLALQKALANGGVTFELRFEQTTDNSLPIDTNAMILSMPLKRENGKNFTTIEGIDYKIQDLSSFLDIGTSLNTARVSGTGGYLQRTIKLMYKSIKGISPKEIGTLIQNGQEEYRKLQAIIEKENKEKSLKADEFVRNAARVSKAKQVKDGFAVQGLSGRIYTVNSNTLAVYEKVQGKIDRYICFVDMGTDIGTEWGRKDGLAKRLLMLAQDLKVADEVHTLNLSQNQDQELMVGAEI